MASDLKDLSPVIRIKDKVVQVGSMSWADFRKLIDAFTSANLPLPTLDSAALRTQISTVQAAASFNGGTIALPDIAGLAIEFVSANFSTITAWIAKHPVLIDSLVAGATNLTAEEAAVLTAGQILRIARAAFKALVDDGVFAEAAGFFGELVGLRPAEINEISPNKQPPLGTETSAGG